MYDIRYPANGLQRNPNPNSKRHNSTKPYLEFLDFSPEIIPDFDVSSELGLLASGGFQIAIDPIHVHTS